MNYRHGRVVAACSNDPGARCYRISEPESYPSLNAAKRANGLNARTCKRFPPSLAELWREAEFEDASRGKPE
jgi:hypothetical protein